VQTLEATTVAYPGGISSYHEEAANILFPGSDPISLPSWEDAAEAVWQGEVEHGVFALENSLAGFVPDTLAILEQGRHAIVAEAVLHIPHCLVGLPGARADQVRELRSHAMALAQCRNAFDATVARVAAASTAEAARAVAELGDPTVAAIASPLAARRSGLEILREDVSDHPENLTRFVALATWSRLDRDAHGEWHTALRIITRHEPGALHDAIEPFRYHRVQMTSLHSRPIMGQPWRYQFYVDIEGHRTDERVRRALRDVGERAAFLESLGSYPVWRDPQRS
jgi:prephenate dehydratase